MNLGLKVVNNFVLFLKLTDKWDSDIIDPVEGETNQNKIGNVRITWHWCAFVQTNLQWKKQYVLHSLSVCSLRCPACNAHAQYYHLWPVWFYGLFQHDVINGTIFKKKKLNNMCYVFSTASSETFLILRKIERDMINNVYWSYVQYPSFLSGLNDTWIFSKDFRKILKYKFHENTSSGSGRTDRRQTVDKQTDMTKLIVSLHNFANATKNVLIFFYYVTENQLHFCCEVGSTKDVQEHYACLFCKSTWNSVDEMMNAFILSQISCMTLLPSLLLKTFLRTKGLYLYSWS
jgi:hypothetical protein